MIRLLVLLSLFGAAIARADTRRVAIIVGNNTGGADEKPLHFAEADAGKLAAVLGELGGVAPDDLVLLQGKGMAALSDAFARATQRIAALHQDPARRVVLEFYFSGHSDGEAIELGRDRLGYADLRRYLAATGANVRVVLVDSCKSGALLAEKGGARGPSFQIHLTDDVASSGEALLTSSAADEVALESSAIGGSYFTHHLVSGLRGAADTSGDGRVTLGEAYEYAYQHTLATTGQTLIGPQHPAYAYRLSGEGELVLSELGGANASIQLPAGFERAVVVDRVRDQVIAEVSGDARPTIAVVPGSYTIHAWQRGTPYEGTIEVARGVHAIVRWNELARAAVPSTRAKGVAVAAPGAADTAEDTSTWLVAGGATTGIASGIGVVFGARLETRWPSGLSLAFTAASKSPGSYREGATAMLVGYGRAIGDHRIRGWAGIEAGPGLFLQTVEGGATAYSGAVVAGPYAGGSVRVTSDVAIAVELTLPVAGLVLDHEATLRALPAAWLGAIFAM